MKKLFVILFLLSFALTSCQKSIVDKQYEHLKDSVYNHMNDLPNLTGILTPYQKDSLNSKVRMDISKPIEVIDNNIEYVNFEGHTLVNLNRNTSSLSLFHDPECYKCKYSK